MAENYIDKEEKYSKEFYNYITSKESKQKLSLTNKIKSYFIFIFYFVSSPFIVLYFISKFSFCNLIKLFNKNKKCNLLENTIGYTHIEGFEDEIEYFNNMYEKSLNKEKKEK